MKKVLKFLGKFFKVLFKIIFIIAFALVIYFLFTKPVHEEIYEEDLSRLPVAEINGNNITVSDVRNWRYDKNSPTQKNWVEKIYNLDQIKGVWFIVEPFSKWDGVAHTMFVFDFENQDSVVVSVESRREKGEKYSAFWGLFDQYEVIYIWGMEEDLIARRVVNQGNDLYMFPLNIDLVYAKALFLDLVDTTNSLVDKPQFYNTLVNNCTNVLAHSANRAKKGTAPWDISRILPGYSEEFLYKMKYIKSEGTLEEIKKKYHINDIVLEIKDYNNFSTELRKGLEKR